VVFCNISSTYISKRIKSGSMIYKPKDDAGIPQKLYEAFRERGWYTRSFFTWWKQNSMPSNVKDRPSDSCEWVIMLTRSPRYWYDIDAERVALADSTLPREKRGVAPSNKWVGGADGQTKHTMSQPRESGKDANISPKNGRNLRTGDFMQMSLDAEIERQTLYLKSLHDIKHKGGMLHDSDGLPTGLFCNPKGFKGSHFASFPPRFVEILINLSVPKKACAECGKGWKRVVESKPNPSKQANTGVDDRYDGMSNMGGNHQTVAGLHRNKGGVYSNRKYLGFTPDCSCNAPHTMEVLFKVNLTNKRKEKVGMTCCVCNANDFLAAVEPCHRPGIVLDPFLGAGTTGVVAQGLGRWWIGIELKAEYAAMANKRIEAENQLGLF